MIRNVLWLVQRLVRTFLAELCCVLATGLPTALADPLWRLALAFERHCEAAALARAAASFDAAHHDAFAAFEAVLLQLDNRWNTSASDLHLARLPARLRRRLAARLAWGRTASGVVGGAVVEAAHDRLTQATLLRLATGHFERALATDVLDRATIALDTWRSLAGWADDAPLRRATAELAWRWGDHDTAWKTIAPLLRQERCPSPFDVLDWGMRALAEVPPGPERLELARACFERGRRWLPEARRTWRLGATLARLDGDFDTEARYLSRLVARHPQALDARFRRHGIECGITYKLGGAGGDATATTTLEGSLLLDVPIRMEVGETVEVTARLDLPDGVEGATLYPLPPAGWGLAAEPNRLTPDADGAARFRLTALRGDRVRGGPWPLVVLAVTPRGHVVTRTEVAVDDLHPGEALLVVTEDHEIHEERGFLRPDLLEKVLVEKSRFAADLAADEGVPWTHCVEVGSTLALGERAAESGDGRWAELRSKVRRHLVDEVARGHDLQPHLHTFNDPAYGHFPYRMAEGGQGWRPSLRFLLTSAEARGDWASVTPPPGRGRTDPTLPDPTLDRLASVERAVAQLETVARAGQPDHCAVLWRSGLLEYGATPDERAWSAVALRRAGLLAASDRAKPAGPGPEAVPPAFPAGWRRPFDPVPGGPLFQLPIVANVEGDYRMGRRRLERRARATVAAVAGRPGVHCFTLLTHDKFLNARRGGDEFLFDREGGEWSLIRQHLMTWRRAGARPVTATEAVRALVDDRGWHPEPLLLGESWSEGSGEVGPTVRYAIEIVGPRPPASPERPFPLRIALPCSLRAGVESVEAFHDDSVLPIELEERSAGGVEALWVDLPAFDRPLTLALRLRPGVRRADFRDPTP